MPRLFQIVLVQPDGFAPALALEPTAKLLYFALRRLGHAARIEVNGFLHDGANIVVGAHLLDPEVAVQLPPTTVIYNTEPVGLRSHALAGLLPFANRFAIWDYSARNAVALAAELPRARVRVVEPGYVPELTRVGPLPDCDKDIDVLFYGAASAHRKPVIDALSASGLRVHHLTATYADERDAWLVRAKLVLAMAYERGTPFAIGRVIYPMANRCAVVVEHEPGDDVPPDLRPGLALCGREDVVAVCRSLVADASARNDVARRGFQCLSQRDFTATLREALASEAGFE